MRSARIVASLFALMVVLLLILSVATIPACATRTAEQQAIEREMDVPAGLEAAVFMPKRNRLVAPVEPQALATGKQDLQVEPQFAVFDGVLCEMVRGQWRPKPPGTPWGTHTVCVCQDSLGNVTTLDFIRRAE